MNKLLIIGALLSAFVFAGCNPGVNAEQDRPVAEVKADAEKLDAAKLRSKVLEYKDAIVKKSAELAKASEKLKDIPVAEIAGEKAAQIKKEIEEIGASVSKLKDRYQVYYDQLKAKAGDLTGLDL